MKIYKLPQLAEMSPDGEYCLNSEDIKSDAVYLYYGRLRPGEKKRRLTAREGHEEIVYIIKGAITAKHGKTVFQAGAGEAFHCTGEVFIDNPNDDEAIYLAAGGRAKEATKAPKEEASTVTPPPADEKPATVQAPESPVAEEEPTDNTDDEFIITKD
jgi:uncharacterized cupin superfamily protein